MPAPDGTGSANDNARLMTITHGGSHGRHATLPVPRQPARTGSGSLRTDAPPTPGTTPPAKTGPRHATGPATTRNGTVPATRDGTATATRVDAAPARVDTAPAPRVRLGAQIAVVAAAVAAYFLVRGATEAAYGDALRHARALVDVERLLGIYWEPQLQESVAGSPRIATVLNSIYIYGHWPVIVASLLWLARCHPAIYLRTRNAMLVSGAIGLIVFVSFPVAPPRLAGLGMTDTVSVASHAYRVLQPTMFTNQYAAMPSLHVGWDLLIGLGLAAALRRPLLRALAMMMPVAMLVAVVLTANHYILDAVVGATLTSVCWLLAGRGWAGVSIGLRRGAGALLRRPVGKVARRQTPTGTLVQSQRPVGKPAQRQRAEVPRG